MFLFFIWSCSSIKAWDCLKQLVFWEGSCFRFFGGVKTILISPELKLVFLALNPLIYLLWNNSSNYKNWFWKKMFWKDFRSAINYSFEGKTGIQKLIKWTIFELSLLWVQCHILHVNNTMVSSLEMALILSLFPSF